MKKSDFYYDLDEGLIAQTPLENRTFSRMLVLDKKNDNISHKHFYDLLDYINQGDTLVLNDTKVFPARLKGLKMPTKSAIEILLQKRISLNEWEAIVYPGKKVRKGASLYFSENLTANVLDVLDNGNRIISFDFEGDFYAILDEIGETPLPPYITETLEDSDRYQTVYANDLGSSAAPTAGLHFTNEILDKLKSKEVNIVFITLHVGLGTFRPLKAEKLEEHHMHSEYFEISKKAADIINDTKKNEKKVIAVGTTTVRTLESVADKDGLVQESTGFTDIFIYPPYKFKIVDSIITNFHLPESTLIILVSAFLGQEKTLKAYKLAVKEKYRFFSFGDLMFIK